MKVVVYGASGRSGSRILQELTGRGHTAVTPARHEDDLSNSATIARTISGADAVISAYAPPQDDTDQLIGVTRRQIEAVERAASGIRLLVVGGAGSLEVAPGVTLTASGHLPAAWLPIAVSHEKALELLRASNIDWTYLSPAAYFEPGERTGKFRLGKDNLIANEKGESRISMEDYAIALVDELEKPAHRRARFSIGY
ncbi:MAG: NAD(P)H-binding protein [Acidobacteriota bacterium]|nr:NAD(P)H-binding protein [Acidobacteriota bacterium]